MASTAPYSISLNPDVARQLNHLGGTVLLLDVPPALILGFDQQTFQVGQKFKGLKMIPPGVHLLSFCQLSQTGQVAAYAGRFLSLAEGQVVVMRWDASVEALTDLPDQDEVDRYTLGVRRYDFDAGLAPYNLSAYATWQRLSGHITPAVIEQLQPTPQAWFSITAEEEPEGSRQQTKAEQQLSHQLSQRDGNPSLQPGCEQAGRDDADLPTRMQSLSTGRQAPSTLDPRRAPTDCVSGSQPAGNRHPHRHQAASIDSPSSVIPSPEKILGHDGNAAPAAVSCSSSEQGPPCSRQSQSRVGMVGRCQYSRLRRLVKAHGLTSQQLTEQNLDRSGQLEQLLHQRWHDQESCLVGELQWAFLAFLLCQSLEGFSQWKALLHLILSCSSAIQHCPTFFASVCAALRHQLAHGISQAKDAASANEDNADGQSLLGTFVTDELMAGGFMRQLLQPFLEDISHARTGQVNRQLREEASRLNSFVQQAFGWNLGLQELRSQNVSSAHDSGLTPEAIDEADDEAPVVIDLEEPYAL
ncbi:hypothetical protein WJX74_003717 [Apatococcus lobatus]|uniref:AAR2 splicing factor homolog n=1 Tax=Apatococcus lobatus TaxID=904363 RepID=A0AAW1RUX1_9CHLO